MAHRIITSNPFKEYVLVDDPKDISEVFDHIRDRKNIIICDPNLCRKSNRLSAEALFRSEGYIVTMKFFENDPKKCLENIRHRADGRNIKTFESFRYDLPVEERHLRIWQNK